MAVNVIVQARMGSKRFPGKVMADLHGKPMIGHLIDCLRQVKLAEHIVYAIPEKDREGPLGKYLEEQNVHIVTGPEQDVAERFRLALEQFPCGGFIRICADSPLALAENIDHLIMTHETAPEPIFVQSTGPQGTTAQLCNTQLFLNALPDYDEECREHVLSPFVRGTSFLIDRPEDLERVAGLLAKMYFETRNYDA